MKTTKSQTLVSKISSFEQPYLCPECQCVVKFRYDSTIKMTTRVDMKPDDNSDTKHASITDFKTKMDPEIHCPYCNTRMEEIDEQMLPLVRRLMRHGVYVYGYGNCSIDDFDTTVHNIQRVNIYEIYRIDPDYNDSDESDHVVEGYRGPWLEFVVEHDQNTKETIYDLLSTIAAKLSSAYRYYVSYRPMPGDSNKTIMRLMVAPAKHEEQYRAIWSVIFDKNIDVHDPDVIDRYVSFHIVAMNCLYVYMRTITGAM